MTVRDPVAVAAEVAVVATEVAVAVTAVAAVAVVADPRNERFCQASSSLRQLGEYASDP